MPWVLCLCQLTFLLFLCQLLNLCFKNSKTLLICCLLTVESQRLTGESWMKNVWPHVFGLDIHWLDVFIFCHLILSNVFMAPSQSDLKLFSPDYLKEALRALCVTSTAQYSWASIVYTPAQDMSSETAVGGPSSAPSVWAGKHITHMIPLEISPPGQERFCPAEGTDLTSKNH